MTLTHLREMASLVKGSASEVLINDCVTQFKALAERFTSYDYLILKQQLARFFQDKHIKVSLFIQDGIQSLDGTLFLNVAGPGVIHGDRPGAVRLLDPASGQVKKEKQIPLLHSKHWEANPFTRRLQGTTTPQLGLNIYAADRVKPQVPLKLDAAGESSAKPKIIEQDKSEDDTKASSASGGSGGGTAAMAEFNQLAHLIGLAADEMSGHPS